MKSYVTLNELKSIGYLDIAKTDYDTTLLRMIENTSEDIDHLCFRHFDCQEKTIYLDGASRVLIPVEDILSITSLNLDINGSGSYTTVLTQGTDYILYPSDSYSSFPKIKLRMTLTSSYGSFAAGIPQGVQITGIFGHGDGNSATPYSASGAVVNTGGVTASATTHALATGKGLLFSAGMTVRIGSEQLYVNAVNEDTLTWVRAMNGTVAATHTAGDVISIYSYPGPIVESTLLMVTNWWKQRENPTTFMAGGQATGTYKITPEIDQIIRGRLNHHIKRMIN